MTQYRNESAAAQAFVVAIALAIVIAPAALSSQPDDEPAIDAAATQAPAARAADADGREEFAALSDDVIEEADLESKWFTVARPSVWFPSLSGEARFGASSGNTTLDLDTSFGLDDSEPSFNAESWIGYDRFRLRLDAFDYGAEATTTLNGVVTINDINIAASTPIENDLGITSVAGQLGFDLFGDLLENPQRPEMEQNASLRMTVLGGARGINVDHRIAAGGVEVADYDQWAGVGEVGGNVTLVLDPDWEFPGSWAVGFTGLVGYGEFDDVEMTTLDLSVNLTYMPTENIGVVFGYRQFDISVEDESGDDQFELDSGRLAGLYVGASISFY